MEPDLIKAAQELVDSVAFDVNGKLIGGQWVGGHGGLVSRETIQKSDALRRILSRARPSSHGGDA